MLRRVTFTLVGIAFFAYLIFFGREGGDAVLLFFPFTMIPYIVIDRPIVGSLSLCSSLSFR